MEKPIPRGRVISIYTGRKHTKQQIDRKYGENRADYALCNSRGRCINANRTTDAAARFANDARGTRFENNSIMRANKVFHLKSSRRIPPHKEILTSYGGEYWI